MFLLRLMANLIDWLVFAMIFMGLFFGLDALTPAHYYEQELLHWGSGIAWLVGVVCVPLLFHYPFMRQGQTIGKGFFALQVQHIDTGEPLDFWPMFQRELLAKLMSCYIMCAPVLIGKQPKYDEAAGAKVVLKKRSKG